MWKTYCNERITLIEEALSHWIPAQEGLLKFLFESMRYSLFAGGKRLRPVLLMAAADAVGGEGRRYLRVACALEMIHTYSLIHDDLPAMDNDDYRRGKLTNHKVFGEGMAILAGDGLLTAAFEQMLLQEEVDAACLTQVVREIAAAAGPAGMVGGQAVDLAASGQAQPLNQEELRFMHRAKTGALFRAALRGGGLLAGATQEQLAALTVYAEEFGLAFQITDDILDVTGDEATIGKPVGSDERNEKETYVSLYSLDGARRMAEESVQRAVTAIEIFGAEADVLRSLATYLVSREK